MARHADPDDRSFAQSLLRAFAGGVAALAVTFAVTAVLTQVGRSDDQPSSAAVTAPTPVESEALAAVPSPSPSASPSPTPTREPTEAPAESATVDPSAVTVQVLHATANEQQAQAAAAALREMGYTVVVVNPTPRQVDVTTILASPGQQDAAEQLRRRDPRFAEVAPNDGFDESVDLHVLVGPDFPA